MAMTLFSLNETSRPTHPFKPGDGRGCSQSISEKFELGRSPPQRGEMR